MNKLGIRGRRWLKAFHVLFSMTWIGAGITTTIIPFVTGNTTSGAELYAVVNQRNGTLFKPNTLA